jgi:hypothetical protein
MELSTVNQTLTQNHIPIGIESTKPKSKAKSKKEPNISTLELSDEDRLCLVAESAYYKAEARGFESGHELEDWFAAEAEVTQ